MESARMCLDHEDYDSCVSRCYYAMFHGTIAALESIGVFQEKWSHGGVRNALGKEMVIERKMYSRKVGRYLEKVYTLRLRGDYKINAVDSEDANEALSMGTEFLTEVKEVS